MASTLLDPLNLVGYLIVDDDRSQHRKKKSRGPSLSSWFQGTVDEDDEATDDFIAIPAWVEAEGDTDEDRGSLWEELLVQVQQPLPPKFEAKTLAPLGARIGEQQAGNAGLVVMSLLSTDEAVLPTLLGESTYDVPFEGVDESKEDDDSSEDDENLPMMVERFRVSSGENAWWNGSDEIQNDDFSGRRLKHDTNKITVAILHVSSRIGIEILDLLLKENSETERNGGPKVLLNSQGPSASAGTIFLWTMLSVTVGACACCCMLAFVGYVAEEETVPQQPARRQLTLSQVRENFPSFLYRPDNHVEQPLDDECAICLDEFTEGMQLRKLPCGHVFHATCVARWLIERHAVCPLCKMDLFEEEPPEVDADRVADLQERYGALGPITRWFSSSGPTNTAGATQPSTRGTWWPWASGPSTSPSTTATPGVPTAPPAGAFQWGFSRLSTGEETHGAATAAAVPPSPPLWQSAMQWFGQRRRLGTEGGGMLTELTEPLLLSDRGDDAGTIATTAVPSGAVESGAPGEPEPSSEIEASPSSPVEV